MKVYVKKVENLTLPKKGSDLAAGYDIIATSDPQIVGTPSECGFFWKSIDYIQYDTDIYLSPSCIMSHVLIHPRSSISKYNLMLKNGIGLADADYTGMYICKFSYCWQPKDLQIKFLYSRVLGREIQGKVDTEKIYKKGDKIAQLVFEPTTQVEFEIVDELTETNRGAGGFGSSGV